MTLSTKTSVRTLWMICALIALSTAAWAGQQWTALGPDGGDVRSLSFDPHNPDHIFLGTSTGSIFVSSDAGNNWTRFAHLGSGDDYVIDHIVIDPQNSEKMFVATWSVENQQAGDLFYSHDGGKAWEIVPAMHNKSIRALSMSASDPKVMVAGTLEGVYRTTDNGKKWEKISQSNTEIKNVESIAIDSKDPNAIYAGTWHLAWKTEDGGQTWKHINKGMIDDSDVFSIIVDSTNSSVVFASACSGIYKSETAGEAFSKIQGIPFSARRTRVLKQDPTNASVVYAGTTEGLWKTADAGKTWKRVTGPEVVVNDVMVDPRNSQRVLLATDRAGVLASTDGAQSFSASNHGYAHRYVTAILADKKDPDTMYVGVVNDREKGGVFMSHDGGQHWTQKSAGLDGRDVFTLKQASNGEIIAGTNRGMFSLGHNASTWSPINNIEEKKFSKSGKSIARSVLSARVSDVAVSGKEWYAATSAGLYKSSNNGQSWSGGPVMGKTDFVSVQSEDEMIAVATRSDVLVSTNNGATWKESNNLAPFVSSIRTLTITPDKQIVLASREGAFRSPNAGGGWEHLQNGLPDKNISYVVYDETRSELLATSSESGVVFKSTDGGQSWHRGPDTGYPLRRISVVHGHYVAATPFDGIVVEPDGENHSAAINGGSSN